MTLADVSRVQIRRHLGYPPVGTPQISEGRAGASLIAGMAGYRTDESYSHLEWRLDRLRPSEEAILTGSAYGAIYLANPELETGDVLTVTITGGGLTGAEEIETAVLAGEKPVQFLRRVAAAINQDPQLTSARFAAFSPALDDNAMFPELTITCLRAFTVAIESTGQLGAAVTAHGDLLDPQIQVKFNPAEFVYGYLPICNYLEGAIGGATQNLDTAKADVWTGQSREIEKRQKLYNYFKKQMADFLGVEFFDTRTSRSGGNRMQF